MNLNRLVLVTMKEHGLRRIIAGALRTSGHTVVEAFDEPDMRSEMSNAEFDVILRDARRHPDAALNDVVRLRNAGCATPAVLLVGSVSDGYASEAERLGALLLPAPLRAADLHGALARAEKKPAALSGPPASFDGMTQVSMSPYSPARVR